MPDRLPNADDASNGDYQIDWEGQKAQVHTETHVNFIEAQTQVLNKRRQIKAAKGAIIAVLVSIMVWALIANFVL